MGANRVHQGALNDGSDNQCRRATDGWAAGDGQPA